MRHCPSGKKWVEFFMLSSVFANCIHMGRHLLTQIFMDRLPLPTNWTSFFFPCIFPSPFIYCRKCYPLLIFFSQQPFLTFHLSLTTCFFFFILLFLHHLQKLFLSPIHSLFPKQSSPTVILPLLFKNSFWAGSQGCF